MSCPGTGPCIGWELTLCCLDDGELPGPCVGGVPVPAELLAQASLAASQFVWAKTGRQFSECTAQIRPCRQVCLDRLDFSNFVGFPYYPFYLDGQWVNLSCVCGDDCSCTKMSQIQLPQPVCFVSEVLIDGAVLPSTSYRVDDFSRLVRVDGFDWPRCQDMTLEADQPGTFAVTVSWGKSVPELALMAAAEIACDLIKACMGASCNLPQRATSVARQGVTVTMAAAQTAWKDGQTGYKLLDMAIQAYNPRNLQRRSGVYSPDMPKWKITTQEPGATP